MDCSSDQDDEQVWVRDCRLCDGVPIRLDRVDRHVNAVHQTQPKLFCSFPKCNFGSTYSSKEVRRHISRHHGDDEGVRVIDRRLFFQERCAVIVDECFGASVDRLIDWKQLDIAEAALVRRQKDRRMVTPPVAAQHDTGKTDKCQIVDGMTGRPVKTRRPKDEVTPQTAAQKRAADGRRPNTDPTHRKKPKRADANDGVVSLMKSLGSPTDSMSEAARRRHESLRSREAALWQSAVAKSDAARPLALRRLTATSAEAVAQAVCTSIDWAALTRSARGKTSPAFTCPECGEAVAHIKRHFLRVHLSRPTLLCALCPYTVNCDDASRIRKHMHTHHQDDSARPFIDNRDIHNEAYFEWRKNFTV